jgi:hypothetical protein
MCQRIGARRASDGSSPTTSCASALRSSDSSGIGCGVERLAYALRRLHLQLQQFLVLGLQPAGAALGQQLRQTLHMADGGAQFVGQLPLKGIQVQVQLLQVARAVIHRALQGFVVAQQQRLGLLAWRDVAAHAVIAKEAAGGVEARHAADRDPQPASVAGVDLELQRAEGAACVQVGTVLGPLLRAQRFAVRLPALAPFDALGQFAADAMLLRVVQRQQPVLGIGLPVPVGGQPGYRRPALFAGHQLRVGLAPFADIAAHAFVADDRNLGVVAWPPADRDPVCRPARRTRLELDLAEGLEPRRTTSSAGADGRSPRTSRPTARPVPASGGRPRRARFPRRWPACRRPGACQAAPRASGALRRAHAAGVGRRTGGSTPGSCAAAAGSANAPAAARPAPAAPGRPRPAAAGLRACATTTWQQGRR